ncbi:TROVE domain-containing protein [Asanoa sp. WMMD1127]|uniref:TROVE domain-containing protein n=1 Tax=Asanoa sp. WMMD1127 TaxID=3016107 RepID=UPI0024161B26|nr:TROVE domain-containing protein [Asanoa sp. WMMD1127]MDG4820340.1 TROVE domain-containing protein [Asanoa sp. WMMD1127]
MAKFNRFKVRTATGASPVKSAATPSGLTFEGAPGYARDQKSELFLLAVTNMVGEHTFYESAGDRDSRFAMLVREVAVADPAWTAGFLRWLRGDANMRSASLVGALEATRALVDAGKPGGRQLVASVLRRADEPGEALAYWMSRHGRAIPKPVKRGVADALATLYTEYGLLKYDTAGRGFRFADVLDLVHPTPTAPWQGDLFRLALERRHGRAEVVRESLPMVAANAALRRAAATDPRALLDAERLRAAGMTWEDALSLAGDRLDKGELWSALAPGMGYMALIRNLRNFDQAGVPDEVAARVAARIADPAEVARSRQLPMRFLSAYRAAPSLRWAYALEQAIGHSLASVPELAGRTLVLVDTSGSMQATFSKDGTLRRWDAAVIFGVALAQRCASADVVSFSWGSKAFPVKRGESLLRAIERWQADGYFYGEGTDTAGALRSHYARHDRVVVVTDEQAAYAGGLVDRAVPATVPMYTWNLAGYRLGHAPSGSANRHTFGGLTDQAFRMIGFLEAGTRCAWPWIDGEN